MGKGGGREKLTFLREMHDRGKGPSILVMGEKGGCPSAPMVYE